MNKQTTTGGSWEAETVRNTKRLAFWTLVWLITLALATFGPIVLWDYNKPLSIAAMLLNLAMGIGMILANKRHLRGLDEMQQKVQLEAMGLALGVALIVGLSYSVLDVSNVVPFDAEISHLVVVMGITYGIGVWAGLRRYR